MAKGLEFRESLSIISGGYPREGTGSDGVTQDWTETSGTSGSSTVTYYYHDSATMTDANSTIVYVTVTDEWTAVKRSDNTYEVTVHSVLNSITRERRGSPSPLSVSIFVRRERGGANIWTSGGCVNASANATHATNVDLGTYTIVLPPGQPAVMHGAIYYRSNICGYDNTNPPSIYVDEYWLGINFRNTLPPDYRPGKIRSVSGESTQIEEGTSISVQNTVDKPFTQLELKGDTKQNASPSPDSPQEVQTVTGEQTVTISDGGGNSQTLTVDLGRNFWSDLPKSYSKTLGSCVCVTKPNGHITMNGTSSGSDNWTLDSATAAANGLIVSLEAGTYTMFTDNTTILKQIIWTTADGSSEGLVLSGTSTGIQFTITETRLVYVRAKVTANTTYSEDISVEIQKGDTQRTPIKLCKIGTYQDYIYQSGASWFLHKEIGSVYLEDQTWTLEDTKFKRCTDIPNILYVESDTDAGSALAEDYVVKTDSELGEYPDCLSIGTSYVSVNVENDTSVTPNGLLYYALETPGDDREILDPTLIAQLDALKTRGSYSGQTAITVTGNLAAPLKVGIRVYSGTPTWSSHNREGGWAGVWDGSTFKEMRTEGGPDATGNPPTIFRNDFVWHDQRKIGQE